MAQRNTPSKAKVKKAPARSSKNINPPRWSRFSLTGRNLIMVVSILLFAFVGVYALVQSNALEPDEVQLADQPEKGLLYDGKKVKAKGPCKGGFDITTEEDKKAIGKDHKNCSHLDSGPAGVDVRERIKKVDAELEAMAKHDEKNPPIPSNDTDPGPAEDTAQDLSAGSMTGVYARAIPCRGTGTDGKRVQMVYAYPASRGSRLSSIRPGLVAIAQRTNQVFFASGYESGNGHQVRFATNNGNDGCALSIIPVAISGSSVDTYSEVTAAVRGAGLTQPGRKYVIWVDADAPGRCGQGSIYGDSRPGLDNYNNTLNGYSVVWKTCWNYAEPHELMHNLGGVQPDAPWATPGYHCRDERDIMCYDDGSTSLAMRTFCTRNVDLWRFDCRHDTYYRGVDPSSGYLSNHWNAANSQFLYY